MKRTVVLLMLLTCWGLPAASQESGDKTCYLAAFDELHQMLKGDRPINFKRAVFITENAYLGHRLDYEKDFLKPINQLVRFVKIVAATDRLDYTHKDRRQVLLAASIFRVMKDSLVFDRPDGSAGYRKVPYTYDMDDFWGERDWTNMFVVKLLYDKTGNCHSLPALYKILADEVGTPAYLAAAPNHTYIKQWNDKTGWYNTELTNGRFPSDANIKLNSYIKTEAIAAGVFMDTLSSTENIAYTITDLAQGYVRKFGYEDASTALCWLETALQYYPDYVNALILKAELQKKQYEKLMEEKGATSFSKLWKDPAMKKKFAALEQAYVNVHQTGYRRMPEEMYRNWQARVQKDTTGKIHRFAAPQPFQQYNYHVEVATGGDGQSYEFFDQEATVRIGTVEMNPLTGRITKFITNSAGDFPDGVVSRMYDPALGRWWQVDPLAGKYSSWSPYNFVLGNPIKYVDPDGREVWITHKKQEYKYENGKLYNKDGSEFSGKMKGFLKQSFKALNTIGAVSSGSSLLRGLEGSKFKFNIQRGDNGFVEASANKASLSRVSSQQYANVAGSGGTIYWRPGNTSGGADQNGNTNRPSFIGLAHELGHADNAKDGYSNYMKADPDNYPGYTLDEHYAMHVENTVRSQYGIPLRSSYGTYPNGAAFMRAIIPGTSIQTLTGYDYSKENPVQIPNAP